MSAGAWPNLGAAIARARQNAGMKQGDLAFQLEMTGSAVSRIEARGNLNVGMLRRIARICSVEPHEIVEYAQGLDELEKTTGLGKLRSKVADLEQQVQERAGRLGKSGKR